MISCLAFLSIISPAKPSVWSSSAFPGRAATAFFRPSFELSFRPSFNPLVCRPFSAFGTWLALSLGTSQ